jgi:phosphatidylglycerophosphatase C
VLGGADTASLETLGRDYAVGLHHLLRPEMAARVRWHRAEGHRLVIVSASLAVYLRPLADTLGFDHVIAVELESDPSGRLTGELLGPNVRGPEKARRLRAWMPENSVLRWAYGDSSGDDELLAIADHPVWVGRRAKRNSSTASGGSTSAGDPRGHFG